MTQTTIKVIKVSALSATRATGVAVAEEVRAHGTVEVQAIGPRAVNQAVKAIAVARGHAAPEGMDLIMVPGFRDADPGPLDAEHDDGKTTGIVFRVEPRR